RVLPVRRAPDRRVDTSRSPSGATRYDALSRCDEVRFEATVGGGPLRREVGDTMCVGVHTMRRTHGDGVLGVAGIVDGHRKWRWHDTAHGVLVTKAGVTRRGYHDKTGLDEAIHLDAKGTVATGV